jgi:predicted nucleotidyltransferase
MILTNCEQRILEILLPQPFKEHSIRQLSVTTKTSYALTYESVQSLANKKAIKTKKLGNSVSCRVNLSADPQLLAIASLAHAKKLLHNAKFGFVIEDIKNSLNDVLYIMVLFGSHAKGSAGKQSDVDLLFVIQNKEDIEKIRKMIHIVLSSTNTKIDVEIVTIEWLVMMFEEKHSLGREVLEGSIALHGAEHYYTLVRGYDQKRGH